MIRKPKNRQKKNQNIDNIKDALEKSGDIDCEILELNRVTVEHKTDTTPDTPITSGSVIENINDSLNNICSMDKNKEEYNTEILDNKKQSIKSMIKSLKKDYNAEKDDKLNSNQQNIGQLDYIIQETISQVIREYLRPMKDIDMYLLIKQIVATEVQKIMNSDDDN
ncbi:MAG: hypothetical protein P857_802 [Candidatus Xenolissoclinum pacificiensis L6]|uniref:Uncharacterized protein n=1 Tax=Candidatus Xenolissoclinum pacificiensis L6 TaxID=1401685 RepID=W2V1U9_9RICK|nr:MAG: hypothetical protein P857_802 [Candidatus Xenolissoclinum pacificiensis L6]